MALTPPAADHLPDEVKAYRLIPFIQAWTTSEDRSAELWDMFMAFELVATHLATTSHWTALAILCSVLTKAKYPTGLSSHVQALTWITHKTHPPTVVSFAGQLSLSQVHMVDYGFERAILRFHEWAWEPSQLLTNDDREVLRSLKVVVRDFDLLFHAAKAQLSSLAHV